MIPKDIADWLATDYPTAPTKDALIYKVPTDGRFWAIYSQSYTEVERMFTSLFDVRFVALWDSQDYVYRIHYESKSLQLIQKLGLGSDDEIAFLPEKMGCAEGVRINIQNRLEDTLKTLTVAELEEKSSMTLKEIETECKRDINKAAQKQSIDQYGMWKERSERWSAQDNRTAKKAMTAVVGDWTEQTALGILNGSRTVADIANEYFESHIPEIYSDILFQNLVDAKALEVMKYEGSWVVRKIEFLKCLKNLAEEGCRNIWVYFYDAANIGTALCESVDTLLSNPYDAHVHVDKVDVDIMTIFKMEWKRRTYFEQKVALPRR